ncbi:hypothetical protein C8T65DRAFT_829389 [Cerioporus squamosus]|nr:hypothetical protein C8T65DRAFT_829389 [Cerioporus squamosus]
MTFNASQAASGSSSPTQVHQYPPTYDAGTDKPDNATPPPPFSSLPSLGKVKDADAVVSVREIMRTPSPTPTEARVLSEKTRTCDLKKLAQLLHWRRFTTRRGAWTGFAVIVVLTFLIVLLAYQSKIEEAMLPASDWLRETPGAWLVPIAIMFVLSFPPLFGQELVGFLCGDVWGVWLGFAIFGAGTILGELANYFVFKWFCMARGRKLEEKQLKYALYAQVVLSTAIFSTCGMNVIIFLASAILSLPKQLAIVYIGVTQSGSGTPTTKSANGVKAGS